MTNGGGRMTNSRPCDDVEPAGRALSPFATRHSTFALPPGRLVIRHPPGVYLMPARWGLGPVFVVEWLLASRRWQMYAVRALAVAALLGGLVLVWEVELRDRYRLNQQPLSYKDYGQLGETFFDTVIGTQLAII